MSREFIHCYLSVSWRTLFPGYVGLRRRRKIVLISLSTAIAVTIIGILLLAQTPPQTLEPASPLTILPTDSTNELPSQEAPTTETPSQEAPTTEAQDQETPTDEIPDIEIPENLQVVPEVPYGTIAILLAMLSALLIAQRRSKKKPVQT